MTTLQVLALMNLTRLPFLGLLLMAMGVQSGQSVLKQWNKESEAGPTLQMKLRYILKAKFLPQLLLPFLRVCPTASQWDQQWVYHLWMCLA
jgi:hypothetical protein